MAKVTVNADQVGDDLEEFVASFNFLMPGQGSSLGLDVVDLVVEEIADRSVPDRKDPDDEEWAANEEKYAAYKARKYDALQPGILSGQMLSQESLRGKPEIQADAIEMTYGTGDPPAGTARNGAALTESQKRATDRQKADWFTKSGRRFYELDTTLSADVKDMLADRLDEHIKTGN